MGKSNADKQEVFVSAIIVAAGSSTRMNGIDKIMARLNDIPVLAYTLRAFDQNELISEIVLVTKEQDIFKVSDIVKIGGFKKVKNIVKGSTSRAKSVLAGISATNENTQFYAIHDGARPLVSDEVITTVITDAMRYGAATAAVPSKDTIKVSNANLFVEHTPNRDTLYNIQTPQVFSSELYKKAVDSLSADDINKVTDDCSLIEQYGHSVFLSQGDYSNIKITTPEDMVISQAILNYRRDVNV